MSRFARLDSRLLDFDTTRFVVQTGTGIRFGNGTKLERGDEVPPGTLDPRTLRLEYDCHHIETVEFVLQHDPDLREACARRGIVIGAPTPPKAAISRELDAMSRRELVTLCERHGLPDYGSKEQLRDRLIAILD